RDPGDEPQIGADHLLLGTLRLARAALQLGDQRAESGQTLSGLAHQGLELFDDNRRGLAVAPAEIPPGRRVPAAQRAVPHARARRLDVAVKEGAAVDAGMVGEARQAAFAL